MSEENGKNVEKTSEEARPYTDPETGKFKEGNPGRPKGTKNYHTLFKEALVKIAEESEEYESAEQVMQEIAKVGIEEALEGGFQYYKDVFDRLFGKAPQSVDVTSKGEKVGQVELSDEQYEELIRRALDDEQIIKEGEESNSPEEGEGESD